MEGGCVVLGLLGCLGGIVAGLLYDGLNISITGCMCINSDVIIFPGLVVSDADVLTL